MVRQAVVTVRYAWLASVCTWRPRARTDSSTYCCCAFACDTWSGWEKLPHNGILTVRRAWNGCGVKLNGYAAFWSRIACACCGVKANRLLQLRAVSGGVKRAKTEPFSQRASANFAARLGLAPPD